MTTQNLNVSGQDMLLLDNSTSYFQNLGYTRTSNFQFVLKNLDPQNVPNWNATTTFKLQKQNHLIGNVDLQLTLQLPDASLLDIPYFFTNKLAFAMIDRVRFLVGSNLIQEIEGEWMDLENTLYRPAEMQYVDIVGDARKRPDVRNEPLTLTANQAAAFDQTTVSSDTLRGIYKTPRDDYYGRVEPYMLTTNTSNTVQGRAAAAPWSTTYTTLGANKAEVVPPPPAMPAFTGNKRIQLRNEMLSGYPAVSPANTSVLGTQICGNPATVTFTLPLGLFFSKHPSMYFPLMAIAASQDLTIEVRLRDIGELLQHWYKSNSDNNVSALPQYVQTCSPVAVSKSGFYPAVAPTIQTMQLVCHYIQLSASEADSLVAKPQHVRLFKQVQTLKNTLITMPGSYNGTTTSLYKDFVINLNFLHPVQTIWLTLRDPQDIANNEYFQYLGKSDDEARIVAWDLVINGSSRMPQKTDAQYTMTRLQPLFQNHPIRSFGSDEMAPVVSIDFALNGQSLNPSGHVNLSNAATQQLKLDVAALAGKTYRIDIYAVSLNWCSISGGSAKVVFN